MLESRHLADAVCCVCVSGLLVLILMKPGPFLLRAWELRWRPLRQSICQHLLSSALAAGSLTGVSPVSRQRPLPLIRFSLLGHPGLASPPPVGLGRERREIELRSISTLLWQFEMRGRPASVTVSSSSHCMRIRVSTLIGHVKSHWGRPSDTPLPAPASHGALFHGRLAWLKVIGGLRLWWTDMPNNFHYVAVTLSRALINFSASNHMPVCCRLERNPCLISVHLLGTTVKLCGARSVWRPSSN